MKTQVKYSLHPKDIVKLVYMQPLISLDGWHPGDLFELHDYLGQGLWGGFRLRDRVFKTMNIDNCEVHQKFKRDYIMPLINSVFPTRNS